MSYEYLHSIHVYLVQCSMFSADTRDSYCAPCSEGPGSIIKSPQTERIRSLSINLLKCSST